MYFFQGLVSFDKRLDRLSMLIMDQFQGKQINKNYHVKSLMMMMMMMMMMVVVVVVMIITMEMIVIMTLLTMVTMMMPVINNKQDPS